MHCVPRRSQGTSSQNQAELLVFGTRLTVSRRRTANSRVRLRLTVKQINGRRPKQLGTLFAMQILWCAGELCVFLGRWRPFQCQQRKQVR